MAFGVRRFSLRNQTFGKGGKRRVGLVPSKTIKVNGVKQKPGARAHRGGNQLVNQVKKRTK